MGLLSDPARQQKMMKFISRYNNILSLVCYIVGLVWFLALAYQPLNARNYFSENALLPGLVEGKYHHDSDAMEYSEQLKEELKKDKSLVPREWLLSKFQELGLDVYTQNYTFSYPLDLIKQKMPGQNIYSILRAPRAASTEAIVLTVPLRSRNMQQMLSDSSGGLAMMLSLAKFFRRHTYWAKDIIFLMTGHEQIGMQAWLDGYHDTRSERIQAGPLLGRSGSIQAALNLEMPRLKVSHFNLKLEGLNGQLPNLDLINLIVRLCEREGAIVGFYNQFTTDCDGESALEYAPSVREVKMDEHNVIIPAFGIIKLDFSWYWTIRESDHFSPESLEGYRHSLNTMLHMMKTQASGIASGNHGLFHRYHIEAVTLEGVRVKKGANKYGFLVTGRILEGVFRSLNNLLERFHQSFFFYILPATHRYVSIGLYMPPFGIMALSGLIKALALWVMSVKKESDNDTEPDETKESKAADSQDDTSSDPKSEIEELIAESENERGGFLSIIPILFLCVLMSTLVYIGPEYFAGMSSSFKITPENSLLIGLLALFCASVFFPKILQGGKADEGQMKVDWQLLKSVALIFQCLVFFSLALMNISLAFFLAAAMLPSSVMARPTNNRLLWLLQSLVLMLTSPLALLFIASLVSTLDNDYLYQFGSITEKLVTAFESMKEGIFLSILDRYLFANWTYMAFSFAIFPSWLMFWVVAQCEA